MTLSERIQSCLDDYYNDNADIDVMANLLGESQRVIERADKDFKVITSLVKDVDEGLSRFEVKVQA